MSFAFNAEYYTQQNQDVLTAVLQGVIPSAEWHFNNFGWKELRDPNANFDVSDYLTANVDVQNARINPLDHFLQFGAAEGRAPTAELADVSANFDSADYLANNADVAAAVEAGDFASAYQHWVLFGQFESGRPEAKLQDGTVLEGAGTGTTGSSFTLTSGVDAFTGTSANDTFLAAYDSAGKATLSVGDEIKGGAGTDTIKITKTFAIAQTDVSPTGATVTGVEIATLTSGAEVVANTSSGALSGITTLNSTGSGGATVTAAATTDINLTDASVDTTTDNEIQVNGGKNVTLTLTADDAANDGDATAEISVGATTAASGTVNVTHTGKYADGADNTLSGIAVTGGTAVTVTQNSGITDAQATSALTDGSNNTVTMGQVAVTGSSSTTAVTVNQSAAKTETDAADGSGQIGVTNGAVTISDANASSGTAAGSIATVTLKNYGNSTIDSSAISTVNLEGAGGTLGIGRGALTATPTENTLALNLTGVSGGNITDSEAAADDGFTTINLSGNTSASTINSLIAADATTLNASGDAKITLTGHTMANLETVTVTNTGGLQMYGSALGNAATFTGGSGADGVQLGATTKSHTMGDGDDTVVYAAAAGTGGSVDGGAGTDTVSMTSTLAEAADNSATFNNTYSNFEVLNVSDALANSIDVDALNNVSTVVLAAGANNSTINNIDSGGTVVTKADSTTGLTVNVQSAVVNANDVLNVQFDKTGGVLAMGNLTAANVETINLDVSDTATNGSAANIHTVTLVATAAKSVTLSGNNGVNVTNTGNTAITSFDASGIVANNTTASAGVAPTTDTAANLGVTFASANTTASANVTIKGGAGNDSLTGNASIDNITGGAGDDVIQGQAGADTLDGGEGAADVLSYADVTGATAHSLTNVSGMAINLSASEVSAATIATAMGGTVVLGGGAGVAGSALAAGSAGYLATTAANSTDTMVRDTVSNFEQVVGSSLNDYIAVGSVATTVTAGDGDDKIVAGSAADTIVFADTFANNGTDTVTNFTAGTDKINVDAFETVGTMVNLDGATDAWANEEVFYLFGQAAGAADSAAAAITAINAAATLTDTAATAMVVISDDNSTAIYAVTGDGGTDEATGDTFQLMGTLDSAITSSADILIA